MTEQEIISGSLRNDKASLKKLFENYYPRVMGICLRYSENDVQAKEMMNRSFKEIYTSLHEYALEKSLRFEDWVKQIVIRNAVTVSREDKSHYRIVSTVLVPEGSGVKPTETDDKSLMSKITKENLVISLRKLSPAFRLAYNLSEVDNMPLKDILTLLEIGEGTFKSNLSQAGFHLKKTLSQL